ncbi:MAG TPA: dTDP-4-dehydrorhamnose 3,5-epimerase [Pyrinomonadaceae bacterium]|nr:dTDP-4-dehydrorhamnose 3,5-epimerase [Pyrinomonadaceae bacterium]
MVITETELKGAFVIELEPFEDLRGFFARAWSDREFEAAGLNARFVESNISFNEKKGTLRGMHYQLPPYDQTKLVRCTRGSIYDVIIDLRPDSPTFKQWVAKELSAENHLMLYVPGEFAHGYQTLEDSTEVSYQTTAYYAPEHGRGVRWNDPAFKISWPIDNLVMIERDREYPDFVS